MFRVLIDWGISAPVHGKDIVDGINAVNERYLQGMMFLAGSPESMNGEKLLEAAAMIESPNTEGKIKEVSLAAECVRLCSLTKRVEGVKSEKQYKKKESNATIKRRNYHLYTEDDMRFNNISVNIKDGFPKGVGLQSIHNLRAEWNLGPYKVATRQISFACTACKKKFSKPEQSGENTLDFNEEANYKETVDVFDIDF